MRERERRKKNWRGCLFWLAICIIMQSFLMPKKTKQKIIKVSQITHHYSVQVIMTNPVKGQKASDSSIYVVYNNLVPSFSVPKMSKSWLFFLIFYMKVTSFPFYIILLRTFRTSKSLKLWLMRRQSNHMGIKIVVKISLILFSQVWDSKF